VILAGNKSDMDEERIVSVDSGRLLAEQLGEFTVVAESHVWAWNSHIFTLILKIFKCIVLSFLETIVLYVIMH